VQHAARAPFALTLATALLITTIWTQTHPQQAEPLFQWASTNVHNLSYAPVRSFVLSALFLPDGRILVNLGLLLAAIIPLERRIGTIRALAVFASAHIGATVLTEGWIWYAVHAGAMSTAAEYQDDVGISYGLFCVAAAALRFAPVKFRVAGVTALAGYILIPFALDPNMTSTGHVLSMAIGLAWWPLLARVAKRRKAADEQRRGASPALARTVSPGRGSL
jgi:hypothetical protein